YAGERDALNPVPWIQDRVWYQIFPERFHKTNSNDKGFEPWGTPPTRENFMGGDIKGIIKKVDYLKELGVNALYLNPVFESRTNHKYDIENYFEIDPQFGSKEDLKNLVSICHRYGIKV